MRIGIDFDNTLINYDDSFVRVARELGWTPPPGVGGKNGVREFVRGLEEGEEKWRRLQAAVYGPRIGHARLRDGVRPFLEQATARGATLFVVSHKTRFATGDPEQICDLRQAAATWLWQQGILAPVGSGIPPEHLFFAATRTEKVARITQLRCDLFIDDLPEVFADPGFPPATRRILLDPWGDLAADPAWERCRDWEAISRLLFA
ncbi:MAG: HAD family hydrolase [Magnetococcales bacterium]|nr:HAD family hydrolase [Magnetococcales bacterium]